MRLSHQLPFHYGRHLAAIRSSGRLEDLCEQIHVGGGQAAASAPEVIAAVRSRTPPTLESRRTSRGSRPAVAGGARQWRLLEQCQMFNPTSQFLRDSRLLPMARSSRFSSWTTGFECRPNRSTSDYMQGDEDKWQRPSAPGLGDLHRQVEEADGKKTVQVSTTHG